MDALSRFLLILGRDLGQGLGYVGQQELEKKRQQEIERLRLTNEVASQLATSLIKLQQTPGYSVLPDDARANLNNLLAKLSTGNIDPEVLTQAQEYTNRVGQANMLASGLLEAYSSNNAEAAGRLAEEIEKAYGPDAVAKLGIPAPFLEAAKGSWEVSKRRQTVQDLGRLASLLMEAPGEADTLVQLFPEYEGYIRSVADFANQAKRLGIQGQQLANLNAALGVLKGSGMTDQKAIEEYLVKNVGLPEETAKSLAPSISRSISFDLTGKKAALSNALVESVRNAGFLDEEQAKQYLVSQGADPTEAERIARQVVSENRLNRAQRELQLKGLETQVAAQRSEHVARVADQVSAMLLNHPNPTRDAAIEMARSLLPSVADPKEVEAAADLALAFWLEKKDIRADAQLKLAKAQAEAYKGLVDAAVIGGQSEEGFIKSLNQLAPDLSEGAKNILLSQFRAMKAAKDAGAPEELVKFASQFNPSTPEALEGVVSLVRNYAINTLKMKPEDADKAIGALRGVWSTGIEEHRSQQLDNAAKLGALYGRIGRPELIDQVFTDPTLRETARAAAATAKKEIAREDIKEAFALAGALAKANVPTKEATSILGQYFDPAIAKVVTANYDAVAFLEKQGALNTIVEQVSKLVANAKPEDVGRLVGEAYNQIREQYGDKVANATRRIFQTVAEDSAKLKSLQLKKFEGDLEELRARTAKIMNDIWADKEQIALARERLKTEWERLKLDKEEFELNKYVALAKLTAEQEGGSLKEAGQTLNEMFKVLQNQLEIAGVDPQCFSSSGGIIGYVQGPGCKKAIENAIQTDPNVRLTYNFVQSLSQSIMGATGITPPPSGTQQQGGGTGQPTGNKPAGKLPPFKANPIAFGAGRLPATQLFGAQSGNVSGYKPRDIGTALFLMTTEHVPGVSDDNPIQVKHPKLAKKAEECSKKEGVLARAACQAQKLHSGSGLNNGAKLAVRHFLPTLATDMDKPIGKFSLAEEGGPLNVVRRNKLLYNTINKFRSLNGLPPLKKTEITGRDIAAVYGYHSLLAYGKALTGTSLARVAQAAEKGNQDAQRLLAAIAYTYTFAPPRLEDKLDPRGLYSAAKGILIRRGFLIPRESETAFHALLSEAYNIFNTDRLGQLYFEAKKNLRGAKR